MEKMTLPKSDWVLVTAAALFVLIVGISLYWLLHAPIGDKDKFTAYMSLYDSVVKGTFLSLFTTIISLKVGYTFLSFALNKFADK